MEPTDLYYIHEPTERRPVSQLVEFVPIGEFLDDEPSCRALWDFASTSFKTRSKFLTVWPHVRFVAVHRRDFGIGGLLLVSTPINWQIDYVVVDEKLRGQGIAAALVNETLNQALKRNVPYVMLTSRPGLRPLYEGQCGFRVVGGNDKTSGSHAPRGNLLPPLRGGVALADTAER
jgi:GNAT superfamily N-acetyltransferase